MVTHEIVRGVTGVAGTGEVGRRAAGKIFTGMFGLEALYAFVIILASLMIYFGTRELWHLSKHKGIYYFRQAFLFFAVAYFFRTFIKFILHSFNLTRVLDFSPRLIGPLTLFLFVYFSTMGLFYLLYSLKYKQWKDNITLIGLQVLSLVIAFVSISTREPKALLITHLAVLVFILITGYQAHQKTKNKSSLYIIYVLLFIFWLLNILDIVIPNALATFQLLIYLLSTGVFLLILYKVLRRVGA